MIQRNMTPADELGYIRAEIRRLKAREAELRAEILETGDASGTEYTIEIRTQERRTFDRSRLPQDIQDDPAYWKLSTSQIVKSVPVGNAALAAAISLIDDQDS